MGGKGPQVIVSSDSATAAVNTHSALTTGVHGVTGNVVGTTDAQALSNKTFTDSPILTQIATPSTPAAGLNKIYPKSDGFFYALDPSGAERKIGSGAGSINYLQQNADAESGIAPWATYADGAAAPVDGTGGSPTLTFVSNASVLLRGTKNFLLTPGALGNGVSFEITPDQADRGSMLSVSFDYVITSPGNYTDGDLQVWIYDENGAVIIQPAPYKILGNYLVGKFSGVFQSPSTLTKLRVLIHQATSATSYTSVRFDNFQCGPVTKVYGAPITDWQAYTPTGAWNTNTTYTGYWRRVGDSVEILANIQCTGAPNAVGATVNIPSFLTPDTTKLPTTTAMSVGTAACRQNSSTLRYLFNAQFSGGSGVFFQSILTASSNSHETVTVTNVAPFTFAASDNITVHFILPVTGWSSGVLMSSDTDTRVCAARYSQGATQNIAGTDTLVLFDTKNIDTHSAYSAGVFTCPLPGLYRVSATIDFAANATGARSAKLYKNGSVYAALGYKLASGTVDDVLSGSALVSCLAGDTLSVYASQGSGGSLNSAPSGVQFQHLNIERLTGPSAIAANESVNASYIASGNTSVVTGATATVIAFASKQHDSHGAFSGTVFTAPASGKYTVKCKVTFGAAESWSADTYPAIYLYKNGSVAVALDELTVLSALTSKRFGGLKGTYTIALNAGDTIDIRATHGESGSRTVSFNSIQSNETWISIDRVGN